MKNNVNKKINEEKELNNALGSFESIVKVFCSLVSNNTMEHQQAKDIAKTKADEVRKNFFWKDERNARDGYRSSFKEN